MPPQNFWRYKKYIKHEVLSKLNGCFYVGIKFCTFSLSKKQKQHEIGIIVKLVGDFGNMRPSSPPPFPDKNTLFKKNR